MSSGVSAVNIKKNFGDNEVLKDINLDVKEGELVSILGSSGCGKTTLLRIVAGLEYASSGDVYFGNELQNNISVEKRSIAMVFQKRRLKTSKSVWMKCWSSCGFLDFQIEDLANSPGDKSKGFR
jgi:ABC-type sugar transport system ATPase subunit